MHNREMVFKKVPEKSRFGSRVGTLQEGFSFLDEGKEY